MTNLDIEEEEILQAFENDTLKRSIDAEQIIKQHQSVAKEMLNKDTRINILLPSGDFNLLYAQALREGIPQQALILRILHKFAKGQLIENTYSVSSS